jgi:hypothetical protein
MSGDSHQRPLLERALNRLLEKRMAPINPAQGKSAKIYFWIGVCIALGLGGLPLIGVTVNIWLGGALLLSAFASLVRAFWIWEGSLKLHVFLRIGTVLIAAALFCWLVGSQIVDQYERDHPLRAFQSNHIFVPKPPIFALD